MEKFDLDDFEKDWNGDDTENEICPKCGEYLDGSGFCLYCDLPVITRDDDEEYYDEEYCDEEYEKDDIE